MNKQRTLDIARDYIEAGICVIPMQLDGSKAPAIRWAEYQNRMPTPDEIDRWFSKPSGIGIVCGVVSGGLEVIDFDHDADNVFNAWSELLAPEIRGKLCVVETGGFGFHVLYRAGSVCGNEKIAKTADGLETIIETRGQGGCVVGVGSPLEVHSSGHPYVQTMGVPLPALPVMDRRQRTALWDAARSFDQRSRNEVLADYAKRFTSNPTADVDTSTPWGDFDVRASWADILTPHDWTSHDGEHWTRPNKRLGTSARMVTAKNGCQVLTVFSANAGPLAPSTGSHRTWGKFNAFAALNHGSNSAAAAKAARMEGYGS